MSNERAPQALTQADLDRIFSDRDMLGDELSTDASLEASLIGGLISLDAWDVARVCDEEELSPDLFRDTRHANAYLSLRGPHEEGRPLPLMLELGKIRAGSQRIPAPPNTIMFCEYLTSTGGAEACGGLAYVARLGDNPAAPNVAGWIIRRMREAHARRELLLSAKRLAEAAINPDTTPDEVAVTFSESVSTISAGSNHGSIFNTGADLAAAQNLDEHEPEPGDSISTGIQELDRVLGGGLRMGEVTFMAARPAHGKSALSMNVAANVARQNYGVGTFLYEMPSLRKGRDGRKRAAKYTRRLLTHLSGVPHSDYQHNRFVRGRDRAEDMQDWARAKVELAQIPVFTADVSGSKYTELFQNIRRLKVICSDLKLVVIDYIGLVGGLRGEDKKTTLQRISNELPALAINLGIHILCLSQLNRKCEDTTDKRPQLHHLRDSGDLEQDADNVIMLSMPGQYEEWEGHKGIIWIGARKCREAGPAETVIQFDAPVMWFGGERLPDPVKDSSAPQSGGVGASWKNKR